MTATMQAEHTCDGPLAPNRFQRFIRTHSWASNTFDFVFTAAFFGTAYGLMEHSPTEGVVRAVLFGLLFGPILSLIDNKFARDAFTREQHRVFDAFLLDSRRVSVTSHNAPWLLKMLEARESKSQHDQYALYVVPVIGACAFTDALWQFHKHAWVVSAGWLLFAMAMCWLAVVRFRSADDEPLRFAVAKRILTEAAGARLTVGRAAASLKSWPAQSILWMLSRAIALVRRRSGI